MRGKEREEKLPRKEGGGCLSDDVTEEAFCLKSAPGEAEASKGTPGDAKCVTEILGGGQK